MKSTGEVRRLDQLGRVVIPKDIRTNMDFKKRDPIEFLIDQDKIVMQKYYPACTFCGEKEKDENNRYEFSGKTVCRSCVQELSS
ncbi:MAG: AbrB/MazE/SpoVT family DNA-binding domain-containing protein [Halarsenatibacteraceae bacterium]